MKKLLLAILMLTLFLTVPVQGYCYTAKLASSYNKGSDSSLENYVHAISGFLLVAGGAVGIVGLGIMGISISALPIAAGIGIPIAQCGGIMMITGFALEWYLFLYHCISRL